MPDFLCLGVLTKWLAPVPRSALMEHLCRRRDEASPKNDLLSLFFHGSREGPDAPLILRHIRDELVTFFFAGYETTSMAPRGQIR